MTRPSRVLGFCTLALLLLIVRPVSAQIISAPGGSTGANQSVNLTQVGGLTFSLNADGGMPTHITNGSATADEAGTIATGATGLAEVLSFGYAYDGTSWRRLLSGTDGSLKVTIAGGTLSLAGVFGTVKPPFVSPTGADSALVVGISPTGSGVNLKQVGGANFSLDPDGGIPVHRVNRTTATESATIAAGATGVDENLTFGYAFDGTQWQRLQTPGDGSLAVTIKGGIPIFVLRDLGTGLLPPLAPSFAPPSPATQALAIAVARAAPVPVSVTSLPQICNAVIAVNQTTSTDLKTSTLFLNICSVVLVSATAQNISVIEGTGSNCGTGGTALIGGTTASVAVAANGGFSAVAAQPWLKTQVSGDHLCVLQSGAGNVSGIITYKDAS